MFFFIVLGPGRSILYRAIISVLWPLYVLWFAGGLPGGAVVSVLWFLGGLPGGAVVSVLWFAG